MNENINLCEILKDCPENTEFYCSEIDQNVKFKGIGYACFDGITFMPNESYSMVNADTVRCHIHVNRYGSIFCKGKTPIIFPSKDQRDWSNWKCPKPKFDPKTLKPFDRILVRNCCIDNWGCSFFSNHRKDELFPFLTCDASAIKYCVPYNDDTKHLVGTSDEAPDFYKYWED